MGLPTKQPPDKDGTAGTVLTCGRDRDYVKEEREWDNKQANGLLLRNKKCLLAGRKFLLLVCYVCHRKPTLLGFLVNLYSCVF